MKIKYLINYHGGDGYRNVGQVEDVSDEVGKALVKLRYVAELPVSEIDPKEAKPKGKTKEDKTPVQTKESKEAKPNEPAQPSEPATGEPVKPEEGQQPTPPAQTESQPPTPPTE